MLIYVVEFDDLLVLLLILGFLTEIKSYHSVSTRLIEEHLWYFILESILDALLLK